MTFSLTLGWVSYRYYAVQSNLEGFHRAEATGVDAVEKIIQQLIVLSIQPKNNETTLRADALKRDLRAALDHSNLILDPDFQPYYIVESTFSTLPDVLYEQTTWMTIYERLKNGDSHAHELLGARKAAFAHYQSSFARSLRNQSGLDKNAQTDLEAMKNESQRFESATRDLFAFFDRPARERTEKYLAPLLATLAMQSERTVHQAARLFTTLNNQRIKKSHFESTASLSVSLFLWIISLAFAYAIAREIIRSEATMKTLISRQKNALEKAQRLASIGEISSGIGHEISNPLMVIKGTTDLLEHYFNDVPEAQKYILRIRRMVNRIDTIIRSMKLFLNSQTNTSQSTVVNMEIVMNEASDQLKHKLDEHHVTIETDCPNRDFQFVLGHEEDFIQVFTNLLSNAIDSVQSSQKRLIKIVYEKKDVAIAVSVHDSGPGVPEKYREKIFESLFTTKPKGEGTGLGLSIARNILERHSGQLHLVSSSYGARFEVTLQPASI